MANYIGSNSTDDVMGAGTETPGTPASDRWSSGRGDDTFVYEPARAGGADRFSGGLGKDTVEFRLTTAEWDNLAIRSILTAFKSTVDSRVQGFATGEVPSGTLYTPLSFGIGKSLTVLEVENVRVYVNNQLVLGVAASSREGSVKEAGVDSSYNSTAGSPQAVGSMPKLDGNGNTIPSGATWSVAGVPTASYGSFSITSSGQWTYQLDNNSPLTQALQAGQSVTQVFTVAATAGTSAAFSSVTITIEGSNDSAEVVLTGGDFAVSERGGRANEASGAEGDGASGFLTVTNVDGAPPGTPAENQPFPASISIAGVYGDLVITRGATVGTQNSALWSYTLRNHDARVQALAAQQVVFDVFQLPASAFDGGTQTITIRVVGSDDLPALVSSGGDFSVTEAGGLQNGQVGDPMASGTLVLADLDTTGPLTFAPLTSTPLDANGNRVDTRSALGKYGNFALDPTTGQWTYTLDNSRLATQALQAAGANAAATETLTVASQGNAEATFTITVSIFGADDATQSIVNVYDPVAGSTVEGGAGADATASGRLTAMDADGPAPGSGTPPTGSWLSIVGGRGDPSGLQTFAGRYGDFTLNAQSGIWTYTRNDSGLPYASAEALGGGQTDSDVMFVSSQDNGAMTAISVVIIGRDDPATMTGTSTGAVLEAGGPRSGGSANTFDPQPRAQGTVQLQDKDAGEAGWRPLPAAALTGLYGNFTFDPGTGNWSYMLRNLDPQVEALLTGQQVVDRLTLTSLDGTPFEITVTVQGANDHALITPNGTADSFVKEAGGADDGWPGDPAASGDLDIVDVDGTGAFTEARFRAVPLVNTSDGRNDLTGTYGTFTFNATTGAWTYTLNNNAAATKALYEGQIVTDTMLVYSRDASASHAVTVTVEGSYDQVDLDNTFTADEATGGHQVRAEGWWRSASGTLTAVVPDYRAAGQLSGSPTGQYQVPVEVMLRGVYGTFTVNSSGAWTYTLDNEDPDTLALLSVLDDAGQPMRSARDFLTVASATDATNPVPESYTIAIDVFGAFNPVDYRGLPADTNTPNTGPWAAPGALPALNGNGTISFAVRNFDTGETLRLYAGDPSLVLRPWGTVTVIDGGQTIVAMPASAAASVINQVLFVWDGEGSLARFPALNLGLGIAQGTAGRDNITMTGNGGLAAGYAGHDTITGTAFADHIDGGDGNDLLKGQAGNDTLLGGAGRDEIWGDQGNDRLEGGTEDDTLMGGEGRDTLAGGAGRDRLTGGADEDLFVFGSGPFGMPDDDDVVTDYSVAEDSLWFTRELLSQTGHDTASIAGGGWFNTTTATNIATQNYQADDRFIYDADNGFLYYDADGSGTAAAPQLVAEFTGRPALVADEFVFGSGSGP